MCLFDIGRGFVCVSPEGFADYVRKVSLPTCLIHFGIIIAINFAGQEEITDPEQIQQTVWPIALPQGN